MGIIALSEDIDIPFPRRLFTALADFEVKRGSNSVVWENLKNRFEGGGCFLDLYELDAPEFVGFKVGIEALSAHVSGLDTFVGFEVPKIQNSLISIKNHLNN